MKLTQIFHQLKIKSSFFRIKQLLIILVFLSAGMFANGQSPVTIEERPLVLPTYRVAPPDKNPVFYTGRVYQGAQGHIYPHPLNDVLTDDRRDQTYKAVYLNNEFLELCVVPELGGRIFSALDKTDQFDFFYRQHVIKPALIGMTGAWISGGVEWNIPDHHRATSQAPIDYTMVENPDGSKTAWVGETELTRGLKWMVGLTVRPGKSYVEATIKVFNPTAFVHPFLYWANVSVHCDENYQVIFPPCTQFGVQHAKGEFTPWPTGDGMYGGVDRTGVDLSWWKNHPNPASIFAWNFTDDFLAGYDYKKDAGTVHVANHHVVTGKKFFLWGNNDEAKMYEKVLTEKDGQYLELMVGAFSDNQPDYSWIAPDETKTFTQYWYPVKKIGGVKNANTNAAVNLERKTPASVRIGLCTTADFRSNKIIVTAGNKTILEESKDISPAKPYLNEIAVDPSVKDNEIEVILFDKNGKELISYSPVIPEKEERPQPIEVPKSPKEYGSVEELYLTGLRIEQFRNAIIDPMPYYQEALSRDSMDYRVNTVLGIRYCREGQYSKAEDHLRKAIGRITKNYTRPKDCEANYYLGIVLQLQNRFTEAADQFWKATWDNGFQAVSYFKLAQLACLENNYPNALNLVDQSLAVNGANTSALTLKAFVLRKTGQLQASKEILKSVENMDKLDGWGASEGYFLNSEAGAPKKWTDGNLAQFKSRMGGNVQNVLELAKSYGNIGAYEEAIFVLNQYKVLGEKDSNFPLLSYYAGYYQLKNGSPDLAGKCFQDASQASSDYCFPWRLEEIEILETALKTNPADAKAWYYLGNILYYLNQKDRAISAWEQSVKYDATFSISWRNLGFAYDNATGNHQKSITAYERAIELNNQDPKLFAEIDVVKEKAGISPEERLTFLLKHKATLEKRDDAIARLVGLYNLCGNYDKALEILTKRHFHIWEGGNAFHNVFANANLLQGITYLAKKQYASALKNFQQAATYPDNLEIGEPGDQTANVRINYYIALAYNGLNKQNQAVEYLNKVAQYTDRWNQSELRFYKAMALKKLGKKDEADNLFDQIRKSANEQLTKAGETDFFSKFGDDMRMESRMAYNYYLLGLTFLGEGNHQSALTNFQKSVELDHSQLWGRFLLQPKNQHAIK